jgi:hypothetical protein
MKKIHIILILVLSSLGVYAQSGLSGSAITADNYFNAPDLYLSKLNATKIGSDVLIDRSLFGNQILNVNGTNVVTAIGFDEWKRMYNDLKFANSDTAFIPPIRKLGKNIEAYGKWKSAFPIGILHFDFKQIDPAAVNTGAFAQDADYLREVNVTPNSYLSQKAFVASCMTDNIYGDNVYFIIPSWLYITNTNKKIQSVSVDFGNGEGYKSVALDEPINVIYPSYCENIQIIVKANLVDPANVQSTLYSHSTVYRKGSTAIPLPSEIPSEYDPNAAAAVFPTFSGYYPVGSTTMEFHCEKYLWSNCYQIGVGNLFLHF